MDESDIENIDKLVEAYDKSGGFKFSWQRIKAFIKDKESPVEYII